MKYKGRFYEIAPLEGDVNEVGRKLLRELGDDKIGSFHSLTQYEIPAIDNAATVAFSELQHCYCVILINNVV